jgi:hypothetical protein
MFVVVVVVVVVPRGSSGGSYCGVLGYDTVS